MLTCGKKQPTTVDTGIYWFFLPYTQGLICVGTVGNAVPILIFRWERRSHTYSYFPVGTQFPQRSLTISIRPKLVAQQTTILPLINVFIFLRSVLLIKLGHGHTQTGRGWPGPVIGPTFKFSITCTCTFTRWRHKTKLS